VNEKPFIINSGEALGEFFDAVTELFEKKKYLVFKYPRFGGVRSLDQNALFHVWLTEAAAYYLKKSIDDVTPMEVEAMKRDVKRKCLLENPNFAEFMITEYVYPITKARVKGYTSSAQWGWDGMYHVLTWFQMIAAGDELVLESKGKFKQRQLSTTQ